MARRPSSVRPSVRPSVNFCANRFFSQTNGRIATKLSQDGLQVSMHPRCAQGQGQGQRSRDTRTFADSWNELLRHWRSGLYVAVPSVSAHSDVRRGRISIHRQRVFRWLRRLRQQGFFVIHMCLFHSLQIGSETSATLLLWTDFKIFTIFHCCIERWTADEAGISGCHKYAAAVPRESWVFINITVQLFVHVIQRLISF